MTREELDRILAAHKAWLNNEPGGNRADLSGADLSGADLRRADMRGADLSGANMSGADMSGADMRGANMSGANMSGADMSGANMSWADMRGADLSGANMSGADMSGADGLLKACNYLDAHFERTADGYIAYKTFGGRYDPPRKWVIEPGSVIEENVNPNRADTCGCGINVAPLDWVRSVYGGNIWKVLIRWEWLAGVVVPYNTDGKIRCERVELMEVVE